MAWRFKVSKYKNAAPILPKKEDWVNDIKVGAPQSCGNHVKASAAFIAFNVENRGKNVSQMFPSNSLFQGFEHIPAFLDVKSEWDWLI